MNKWRVVAASYIEDRINQIVAWYEDNRSDAVADRVKAAIFRGFALIGEDPDRTLTSTKYLPGTYRKLKIEDHNIYYHINRRKREVMIYLILGKGQDIPRPIQHKRAVKGTKEDTYEVKPRSS